MQGHEGSNWPDGGVGRASWTRSALAISPRFKISRAFDSLPIRKIFLNEPRMGNVTTVQRKLRTVDNGFSDNGFSENNGFSDNFPADRFSTVCTYEVK